MLLFGGVFWFACDIVFSWLIVLFWICCMFYFVCGLSLACGFIVDVDCLFIRLLIVGYMLHCDSWLFIVV